MDPELVHSVLAAAILLLLIMIFMIVVSLFCKLVCFLGNIFSSPAPVYTPPPQLSMNVLSPSLNRRQIIAMDIEMVGAGDRGEINMPARVTIVSKHHCFYDKYVAPVFPVTDYRSFVSGIRKEDLIGAESYFKVQRQVRDIIKDRILVGHDLEKDLRALGLTHPAEDIRDTALYRPFRKVPHEKPSLKFLARNYLCRTIQNGEHDSTEDARAAMDLYLMVADDWERSLW